MINARLFVINVRRAFFLLLFFSRVEIAFDEYYRGGLHGGINENQSCAQLCESKISKIKGCLVINRLFSSFPDITFKCRIIRGSDRTHDSNFNSPDPNRRNFYDDLYSSRKLIRY